MEQHDCVTADGYIIKCICRHNEDHDEDQFDVPVEEASK